MNDKRRKEIDAIADRLCNCKIDLEALQVEEQEAFDNLPDSLQCAERGDKLQESIDALELAISDIDTVLDSLDEAVRP